MQLALRRIEKRIEKLEKHFAIVNEFDPEECRLEIENLIRSHRELKDFYGEGWIPGHLEFARGLIMARLKEYKKTEAQEIFINYMMKITELQRRYYEGPHELSYPEFLAYQDYVEDYMLWAKIREQKGITDNPPAYKLDEFDVISILGYTGWHKLCEKHGIHRKRQKRFI